MVRRHFLHLSASTFAAALFHKITFFSPGGIALINLPDEVWASIINANGTEQTIKLLKTYGNRFTYRDIEVELKTSSNSQKVTIHSPGSALTKVKLVWKYKTAANSKILGDHWERSYGDLAWKGINPTVQNSWYVIINDGKQTACFGVKTGPNTMCSWAVAPGQISLSLDTHTGGTGVKLGQRKLHAASIVTMLSAGNESPYASTTRFCKMMCDEPLFPELPVYGINDWYVVYGKNSAETIKLQTATMAELVSNTTNKPFSVIDDGWQVADDFSLPNDKFKDMEKVADDIKQIGMKPGLWTRPLIAKTSDPKTLLAPNIAGRNDPNELILDPTIPETLERIRYNLATYKKWGFEMVKHDYSSYDIFGKWGFQMGESFTQPGWKYYDETKTNAEIINQLYQTIKDASKGMYVIGCNTVSHLSAGMFHLCRTGDDTSGKEWARTKKMGVNTLGFRLPQHNNFYAADGDCVGLTKDVPWEKNKQWLQLLAESGSPLFISAQTDILDADKKAAIKLAFVQAATVQPTGEPLDWMENQWPAKWKLNKRVVNFDWDAD
ncbi:MAG: hypothetical protein ABIP30_10040 [Ferruginibacter sp.]